MRSAAQERRRRWPLVAVKRKKSAASAAVVPLTVMGRVRGRAWVGGVGGTGVGEFGESADGEESASGEAVAAGGADFVEAGAEAGAGGDFKLEALLVGGGETGVAEEEVVRVFEVLAGEGDGGFGA